MFHPKPNRKERHAGLDHLPTKMVNHGTGLYGKTVAKKNTHPTVKPIALMAQLLRLAVPQGGTVLDPFAGSGSTGCAAAVENSKHDSPGWKFVGIEADFDGDGFIDQAAGRISHWAGGVEVSVERHSSADTIEEERALREAKHATKAARKTRTTGGTRTTTRRRPNRTGRKSRTAASRRSARRSTTGPAKARAAAASTERGSKTTIGQTSGGSRGTGKADVNRASRRPTMKLHAAVDVAARVANASASKKKRDADASSGNRSAASAQEDQRAVAGRQRQRDLYFLKLAESVREVPPTAFDSPGMRPTADPSGAVLVADGRVIATGYDSELDHGGSKLEAGLAAILSAARSGARTEGVTLYMTRKPTRDILHAAAQAGVVRIVVPDELALG